MPSETGIACSLGLEQRELLTRRGFGTGQLELEPGDRGRRRGPFEAREEQPLDGFGVGGRLGEALLHEQLAGRACAGEREVQLEPERRTGRGETACAELFAERRGQAVEDEPKRFELLDRGLDRQPEQESFGGPPRSERVGLLATCPGVQQSPLLAEARDERRPGQLGHRADPAQSEAGQPGADVGVGRRRPAG